jgi:integrase
MARRAQWPPKVTRHSSGQARVNHKGRDHYLGPYDSDEARQNYAHLIKQLAEQPRQVPTRPAGSLLVAEAVELWLADEGQRYRGVEADHYRRSLAVLVEVAGAVRTADFGVADLERVRKAMNAKGWSAAVINRRVVRVRTVWRWLERQGHAPRGSWDHLRSLPGVPRHDGRFRHSKPRQAASWLDLARVCRKAPRQVRAMLLLGWFTGARPGELCQVRPADIDRTDPECWVFRPRTHKNAWRGQCRVIPLGPVCRKVLAPFLADARDADHLFVPSDRCRVRKLLHYTTDTYGHAVRRAATRAGVEGFCVYSIRHAYRLRVSRAMGLEAARCGMGHTSVDMTAKYASGADTDLAKGVARRLG